MFVNSYCVQRVSVISYCIYRMSVISYCTYRKSVNCYCIYRCPSTATVGYIQCVRQPLLCIQGVCKHCTSHTAETCGSTHCTIGLVAVRDSQNIISCVRQTQDLKFG